MMKQLNITAKISVCTYEELSTTEKKLIIVAKDATQRAYAPYSKFQVGAAVLLDDNTIVSGNNQENAAYPSGLCAERTAIFYANSMYPDRKVKMLALAAFTKDTFTDFMVSPCGACRQVLLETEVRYQSPIRILLYGEKEIYIVDSIKELLPLSFDETYL